MRPAGIVPANVQAATDQRRADGTQAPTASAAPSPPVARPAPQAPATSVAMPAAALTPMAAPPSSEVFMEEAVAVLVADPRLEAPYVEMSIPFTITKSLISNASNNRTFFDVYRF